MAAGDCVVPTTNSEEEAAEDDDDWSDFTSDSNSTTLSSSLVNQSEQKYFPSKDNSWVLDNVAERARLCFPRTSCELQRSIRDPFSETPKKVNNPPLEEKAALLEENM